MTIYIFFCKLDHCKVRLELLTLDYLHGSNPDLSRNDRWERGDGMSIISGLPQTGSLERHRILSESLPLQCCKRGRPRLQ